MTDITVNSYTQEIHATPVGQTEIIVAQTGVTEIFVAPWINPEIGEDITNIPTIIVSSVDFPDIEMIPATSSISVINAGPQGPAGVAGAAGFTYQHLQGGPSTLWTIVHNLGGYPQVTVLETTGDIVEGDVTYISLNELTISFSSAISGTAYLS